jgi:hypothetical protein
MSSLNAIPGYNEAEAAYWQADSQFITASVQLDAAIEQFGINSSQANQYRQQQELALQQQENAAKILAQIRDSARTANADLASPTVTTGQSQSTPAPNARDDGPTQSPTSGGVGAGTSPNAFDSRGPDNTPPASRGTTQQAINTAFAAQIISPRPNELDQYASYTYAISWWLLTPEQYNNLGAAGRRAPAPGTGNWTLLIQSGGAPIAGRSQFFPDDFYFDDLEIESFLMGKGNNMSNNAMEIRFKVVEPNGLTLLQRLFDAVSFAYKNPAPPASAAAGAQVSANQTSRAVPNYAAAQYCLTIEFYGYDSQGNLAAPIKGSSGTGAQATIRKYYPFLLRNITFRTVANQVEYHVVASPVPYDTGTAQARGTIPFPFELAGTTVSQLLQGGPLAVNNRRDDGRQTQPQPANIDNLINSGIAQDQARAQVDQNGNFTGDTTSPFNIVAP